MEDKTVNKLLMGSGCLIVALAVAYGGKIKPNRNIETEVSDYVLPEKFKNDVNQMSNEEINKAIQDNTDYLASAKMSKQQREAIIQMLNYLKSKRG